MAETAIEWCSHVYNAFTGCDRMSPGCAHCYALTAAKRLQAQELGRARVARENGRAEPRMNYQTDGDPRTSGPGFGFTVHWDKLTKPPRFPSGARVFVNSMSDVFHEDAPFGALVALWKVFAARPDVVWIVLTKRAGRMRDMVSALGVAAEWPAWPLPSVWLLVSIENRRFVDRADALRATPAVVRGISAEPLLGPLLYDSDVGMARDREWPGADDDEFCGVPEHLRADIYERCWLDGADLPALDLADIDWLIVGGESGPKHRPMDLQWARDLRDACRERGWRCECGDLNGSHEAFCYRCGAGPDGPRTALFVKQLGGARPGTKLEDLPEDLRIREMPAPVVAA